MNILVIGAGYWGAAIAHEARLAGYNVEVYDDGDDKAGSRVAAGFCDPSSYRSKPFIKRRPPYMTDQAIEASLTWLIDHGGNPVQTWFWNRWGHRDPREDVMSMRIDNNEVITSLAYPIYGERIPISRLGDYSMIIVAAGYRTNEVLGLLEVAPIPIRPLMGRGIVASGTPIVPLPVSVMVAPYKQYMVRALTNGPDAVYKFGVATETEAKRNLAVPYYHIGDTVELNPSSIAFDHLYQVGKAVLDGFTYIRTEVGYRPDAGTFRVEKLASNLIVATGGHRVGLGLAGWAAQRVLTLLEN
jgi:glycine/D-amino acid oxidase-like deaminating enzyme